MLLGVLFLATQGVMVKSPGEYVLSADTDKNGVGETYLLENGRVKVQEGDRLLWQSSPDWHVEQILVADADNDGSEELLMVLWKHGSYGKVRPFWHKGDDNAYSCHLFMYRLCAGRMKAIWCSSALDKPILKVNALTGTKYTILEIQEGFVGNSLPYPLNKAFKPQPTTWQWQGWGFTRSYQRAGESAAPTRPY